MSHRSLITGTSASGNGAYRRRRLALAKLATTDRPVEGTYQAEILNLRFLAKEAEEQGAHGGREPKGPGEAVDTVFSYSYVETALFPDEQADFYSCWQYLRRLND